MANNYNERVPKQAVYDREIPSHHQFPWQGTCPHTYGPVLEATIRGSIQSAAILNRQGVASLSSDNSTTGTAFLHFRSALQQLELVGPHLVALESAKDHRINLRLSLDQDTLSTNLDMAASPELGAYDVEHFHDDFVYLYSKVLDFEPDLQQQQMKANGTDDRLSFQVSFYRAVIMFNIALCLHRQGNQHLDEPVLVTAAHFYDMSMRTISNIPIKDYSEKLMMLMLATWNNQSQIYYRLGRYDHATEILGSLNSLSARLLLEHQLDEVDQKHILNFMLNVITVKEPTTAPCA